MIVHSPTETSASDVGHRVLSLSRGYGFEPVPPEDFGFVHAMARCLMKHKVTSVETFLRVQGIQPYSSFCFREEGVITGIMGLLLLREAAVDQLISGQFDGMEVDFDLLSRPDEVPSIGYGWGIAATTKAAGAAIQAVGMPLRSGPLGALTFITTAVTDVGRHVCITRLGYRPLRHPDDNLLISDPILAQEAA